MFVIYRRASDAARKARELLKLKLDEDSRKAAEAIRKKAEAAKKAAEEEKRKKDEERKYVR